MFLNYLRKVIIICFNYQENIRTKRKQNFVANLREIKRHNDYQFSRGQSKFKMTVNSFTVMDDWERSRFLGGDLNTSTLDPPVDESVLGACRDRLSRAECLSHKLASECSNSLIGEQCEATCGRCGDFKWPDTLDWNARGVVTGGFVHKYAPSQSYYHMRFNIKFQLTK